MLLIDGAVGTVKILRFAQDAPCGLDTNSGAHQFAVQTSLGCTMSTAQHPPLERINAVTANFFFWQGLRWVPMGAALLAVAWSFSANSPVPQTWQSPLLIVVMIVALALSVAAGRWYDRSFGRVHAIPGQHARRTRTKWLVVYPAVLIALVLDGWLRLPVLLSGIAFAVSIEAYRRSTGGGRRHYLIASAVFVVATFAPLLGIVTSGAHAINLLLGLLGATYVVGGLLDHFELRRILPDVVDADTIAGTGSAR